MHGEDQREIMCKYTYILVDTWNHNCLSDHCILYACNYFMYTLKQLIGTRWLQNLKEDVRQNPCLPEDYRIKT